MPPGFTLHRPPLFYIKIYKTCNIIFKIDLEQRHDNDIYRENHVRLTGEMGKAVIAIHGGAGRFLARR
jgi:hypothetical protein